MRTVTIHYLVEESDECVDKEIDIDCEDIRLALPLFDLKRIRNKRVTAVIEKPYEPKPHATASP